MSKTRRLAAVNFPSSGEFNQAMTKARKHEGKRGFSKFVRKLIKAKK